MVSDEYKLWVKLQSAARVLLVEVDGYHTSKASVQTAYFSTASANDYQHYLPRITKTPVLVRSLDQLMSSGGTIELDNSDGLLDAMIYHHFSGHPIRIKHGDASWALADFEQIYTGVISSFEVVSDNRYQIEFSSGQYTLDAPMLALGMTTGDRKGTPYPMTFGYVRNVTPILHTHGTNSVNNIYKLSYGPVEDVCVKLYYDGVEQANPQMTKNNEFGSFTLEEEPTGKVTCDVLGQAPTASGTAYTRGGEIIRHILTDFGHMTIGQIDDQSLIDYDAGAPEIGIYYTASTVNVLDVIDQILYSHTASLSFTRDGLLTIVPPLILEKTTTVEGSEWKSLDKVDNPPAEGIIAMKDNAVHINKTDDVGGGADQSVMLDKLTVGSEIYVVNQDNANEWIDYRVIAVTIVGNVYEFEVGIFDSGNNIKKNKNCDVRFTSTVTTGDSKPTAISINDDNLIGDIGITKDPRKPIWKGVVGYAKNWTVVSDHDSTFNSTKYRYAFYDDPRGEVGHKVEYIDSVAGKSQHGNISYYDDALIEAELALLLNNDQSYLIAPKTYLVGFTIELGDMAEITSARFGLYNQRFIILEVEEDMLSSVSTIKGWWI